MDLISRQAAIDALEKDKASLDNIIKGMSAMDVRLDYYVAQHNQVDSDIYAIKNLPSAEPKTGKWIYHIDDLFPTESTMECSECHKHQPLTCDDNFCHNCGKKMEVEP